MSPCPAPDFSTILTGRHKWATGGWASTGRGMRPILSPTCRNCGQTRQQAASLEHTMLIDLAKERRK